MSLIYALKMLIGPIFSEVRRSKKCGNSVWFTFIWRPSVILQHLFYVGLGFIDVWLSWVED
jgi:hypothetical protein